MTIPVDFTTPILAINWNDIEDPMDKQIWEKLTSQFWLDTNFPLSNDIAGWNKMPEEEQKLAVRVFTGLTLLDTLQAKSGALSLLPAIQTPHEEAVLLNIAFMEAVHAKSYSSIFSTLVGTDRIKETFDWAKNNPYLQKKAQTIDYYYEQDDHQKRKIASVFLESFLFYSGFYLPLYFATKNKINNSADMIRFIIRDEAIHGFYVGYKFQKANEGASPERKEELREFAFNLLLELYENEVKFTQELYDPVGLTEDVKKFLHYNANKALQNLGYDEMFPKDMTNANPAVLSSLSLGSETHDFFSGTGTYFMPEVEETDDDDWDFPDDLGDDDTW